MKVIEKKDLSAILLMLLISAVLVAIWFRDGNLFIGAEEGVLFYNLQYTLDKAINSVWLELFLGMPYFSDLSKWPFISVLFFFNKLGLSNYLLQVFTFFLILSVASTSVYFLLKQTLGNIFNLRVSVFIGSVFYILNPYVISQVWMRGLYTQIFAFAYYPAFLLLFVLFLNTKKIIFLLIGLLISFIFAPAMGNPAYFISLWVLVGVYFLYYLLFEGKDFKSRINICLIFIFFFLSWIVLNSWWFWTTAIYASSYLAPGSVFENSLESLIAVSNQNPIQSVIRLYHTLHFETNPVYGNFYLNPFIVLISWIMPIVALASIYYKRNKALIFYGVLFLIGLFVSLGANPPLGKIFIYFFNHISPLQVFRNPYEKFGLVYLLSYSALFAFGISAISKLTSNKFPKYKFLLPLLIGPIFFVFYCWPMWSGVVINWGTKVSVPDHYQQLDNWLKENNPDDKSVMFLPYLSDLGASYKWSGGEYHGNDPMYQIIGSPVITQTGKNYYLNALKRYIGAKDLTPALSLLGVKYIIERPDVVSPERDKIHTQLLTENYYQPNIGNSITLCQGLNGNSSGPIDCDVKGADSNLSDVYFIHLLVEAFQPLYFDVYIQDQNGIRSRWNGKQIKEYQYYPDPLNPQEWVTIYLNDPIENANLDFRNISKIEIYPKPLGSNSQSQIAKIERVNIDRGLKKSIEGVKKVESNLISPIYEVQNPLPLDEFGLSTEIVYVIGYNELFDQIQSNKNDLNSKIFFIENQNLNKSTVISPLLKPSFENKEKITSTRYAIEVDSAGERLIYLNKAFSSGWKVTVLDDPNELSKGILENIKLLMKPTVSEENHYFANGFANAWKVSSDNGKVLAIFYKPQVFLDLMKKMSFFTFLGVLGISGILSLIYIIKIKIKQR
jgi:hypothetical protein